MKAEILKMLRETNGYISGQEICEKFGVSRTAVWKVIRQLQEEGYKVEAVRNRGYHMVEIPDLLTKEELESCMHTGVGRQEDCLLSGDRFNKSAGETARGRRSACRNVGCGRRADCRKRTQRAVMGFACRNRDFYVDSFKA